MGGRPTMGAGNIDYEVFLAGGAAPAPKATPAPAKPVTEPATPATGTYTVVKGDNLTKIAARHKTTVAKLVEINGIKNANLINVGQVLKIG
jgi:LysM repeat protein